MSKPQEYHELCKRIVKGTEIIESFDKVSCMMRPFMFNDNCSGCFVISSDHTKWCKAWRLFRRILKQADVLWESMTNEEKDEADRLWESEAGGSHD